MSGVLADTSVVLDVFQDDPRWCGWSLSALRGTNTAPLPDFFIGAHAAVEGLTLVTRDPRRVREYFPTVRLVAPAGTA